MTVITICGLIKGEKARYEIDVPLQTSINPQQDSYINMLPLLAQTYAEHAPIIALASKDAKAVQLEVLHASEISEAHVEFVDIQDHFLSYFAQINTLLKDSEEVIIDLSHGFRHLPLLTLIALIVQNISDQDKIKHIFYAQEIDPRSHYMIIDLIEYLDIATISYALTAFNDNYTVASSMKLRTQAYVPLFELLREFSRHIMANSLEAILQKDLGAQIISKMDDLEQNDKHIAALSPLLSQVRLHLKRVNNLKNLPLYKSFSTLAKMLFEKGYWLNALTILYEAFPLYLQHHLVRVGKLEAQKMTYDLNSSLVRWVEVQTLDERQLSRIDEAYFFTHFELLTPFKAFIRRLRTMRNDLAHATGSNVQEDIQSQFEALFDDYQTLVINQDKLKDLASQSNRSAPMCKYSSSYFEEAMQNVFVKLFSPKLPIKVFKDNKIEKINQRKIPPEWGIPSKLNPKQEKFIKLAFSYENAKASKDDDQKYRLMDEMRADFLDKKT